MDKGKVCTAIEYFIYILYSPSFSFQFLGSSFMLWHRYSSASEGLWLTGAASQVFSWHFLSHIWLWLVALGGPYSWTQALLGELFLDFSFHQSWHVYHMCDSESKILFSVNTLTCGTHLHKEFTQRRGKRRLLILQLNCFPYVSDMCSHASTFIFRRWFHIRSILLQ